MTYIPPRPTPGELANAHEKYVIEPAVTSLSGRDGRLSENEARGGTRLTGLPGLGADDLALDFATTGYQSSKSDRVIERIHARVLEAGQNAVEEDGRIHDPTKLPPELRADFVALGGGAPSPEGYRFSERVLTRIMETYGLEDRDALLAEAVRHDGDGNRYLKRSELEAAAKVLTGEVEGIKIISDLDKTIIPPHDDVLPDAPYPGIVQLLHELEAPDGDRADTAYVTARSADRIDEVPAWLDAHDLPDGPIETGISGVPWIAEREKVADISRILEANPGRRFVLFGDSSHRDPEVYRTIQERFPDQITAAFIHRVNNVSEERVAGLHAIDNYAEAAAVLLELNVLDQAAARRVMVAAQLQGLDITDAEIQGLLGER